MRVRWRAKVDACRNGCLCSEESRVVFTRIGALQKDIALLKALAIPLRNVDGLRWVSTNEQETAAQAGRAQGSGMRACLSREASGGRWDRPELHRLLDQLREGDVLVAWKLDRLSRSLRDVLAIMERLADSKAGFRS